MTTDTSNVDKWHASCGTYSSLDGQELVDQLEASVAAPSATPQTLLDAVAWNNTTHVYRLPMCYFVYFVLVILGWKKFCFDSWGIYSAWRPHQSSIAQIALSF